MHELSLAAEIIGIVETAARKQAFSRVRSLRLSVPALAGVEADALRFALEALAPRTLLAGAELVLEQPVAEARCAQCGRTVGITAYGQACEYCGAPCWQVTAVARLQVVDMLVESE